MNIFWAILIDSLSNGVNNPQRNRKKTEQFPLLSCCLRRPTDQQKIFSHDSHVKTQRRGQRAVIGSPSLTRPTAV